MRSVTPDRCLHEVFADQVRRSPDVPALVDEHVTLTYAQLDARAERLAVRLRALGVGPDVLVGVLMERRAEYVVACLAALKAGGAFLVLELAYPPALLADVIADARPRVVVTLAEHAHRLAPDQARIVLDAAGEGADAAAAADAARDAAPAGAVQEAPGDAVPAAQARPTPESLAFVSYSSGTTGRPKGIANPHRAALRSYHWRFGISDPRPGDRVACNVFFVWEMLRPLLRGATVHVIGDDVVYDPAALVRFLREHRITETLMTPSLLDTVLARSGTALGEQVPDLRVLWLNGEVVTRTLAERVLHALPGTRVLNVYSASETHEIAAGDLHDVLELDTTYCAVGRPLDPDRTYVLDPQGAPLPPGVEGELHVGGGCLARGYLNLPDKTAEAFVDDPFAPDPHARMYRTGDRARVVGDGMLEITGRVGTMIKIRGYSIEPGAVEAAIERALAVRSSAVVAHGDEGGDKRLVAYVAREADQRAAGGRAREWHVDAAGRSPQARRILAEHLPHYMVPTVFVEIDALPVHSSGKVDRDRLPAPPEGDAATAGATGDGAAAARPLAAVWAAVLDVDPAGLTDDVDFFDLGGHSLAAAELSTRLAEAFGVEVPLADLVAQPTLADHRKLVRAAREGGHRPAAPRVDLHEEATLDAEIRPRAGAPPRSLAQARTVLLTGATGFLGGFLAAALLATTRARVLCLVRPPDGADEPATAAARRLRVALEQRGLGRAAADARVVALPGDLARPRLGMAAAEFDALSGEVDAIVHAGAHVNLMYPYTALRDVNVGGTREVLRLACRAGATLHHVSSNGVLPPSQRRWSEDTALDGVAGELHDGYGQSKWVAEQLVHQAAERGLHARVYRPGTISGHSVTGAANARDLLGALVTESLRLGYAPAVDGWRAEMTPVDYVSDAITHLAADEGATARVFHLADPDPLPARTLFDRLGRLGYRVRHVDWDEWVGRWHRDRADDAASAPADVLRTGMPSADDLRQITVLDDGGTRPHLERHGLRRPHIDDGLLATYARRFHANGWLHTPPRGHDGSAA